MGCHEHDGAVRMHAMLGCVLSKAALDGFTELLGYRELRPVRCIE
jgi:uncharacterized membrane protein